MGWRSRSRNAPAADDRHARHTPPRAVHSRQSRACRRRRSTPQRGNRPCCRIEFADPRRFEFVVPRQSLDTVDNLGRVANTTDHAQIRKQFDQCRQFGGPLPVGVEHQLFAVDIGVVASEAVAQRRARWSSSINTAASFSWLICRNSAKNRLPTGLVMPACMREFRRSKSSKRSGAGTRQTRDEMDAVLHAARTVRLVVTVPRI